MRKAHKGERMKWPNGIKKRNIMTMKKEYLVNGKDIHPNEHGSTPILESTPC